MSESQQTLLRLALDETAVDWNNRCRYVVVVVPCNPIFIQKRNAAGLQVFRTAANDPAVTHITVLSRRPLPDYVPASDKVQEVIVLDDFLEYPPDVAARLAEHDACIWSLGGSSRGHTEESYTVFTVGYVKAFVDALQRGIASESRPENDPFRFVFVSGEGADPEEKAMLLFARIKVCTCTPAVYSEFSH